MSLHLGHGVHMNKAQIHTAFGDPLLNAGIFPLTQNKGHRGILLLKSFHQRRQQRPADTGKSADADGGIFQPRHFVFFLFQRLFGSINRLNIGKILLAVGRQADTALFSVDQSHSQLIFDGFNGLTHRALGITEEVGGLGKTPQFQNFAKNTVSGNHCRFLHLFFLYFYYNH